MSYSQNKHVVEDSIFCNLLHYLFMGERGRGRGEAGVSLDHEVEELPADILRILLTLLVV